MNLQEARKRLPELEGLSDSDAIDVIQQVYYPQIERTKLEKALGYTAPPPPTPERSTLRAAGDLGLQFAGGAVSGVRMMTDLLGANNAASGGLRSAEDAMQALQSAAAKADQQQIAAILKEAEGKGFLNEVVAAAKAFGTAPAAMVAQAIGSSLPTLATALIPGVGPGAVAARLGMAGAIGAGQGAGAIKGAIYDEVKTAPLPGETPEQTEARAVQAQAYTGPNADQIALGGGLGALAGSTGIERAAGALRHGVTKAAPGMLGRVGMGALTEAAPEALQGGQEKFATNTALAREGMDVDPWAGVVAGGTMEALAGGVTGGLFGIPNPGVKERRDPVKEAGDAVRAAKVPESGPMTRAVNAGTEMVAKQAEADVAAQVNAITPAPVLPTPTTLTGTDAATLMQPPENPLLGAAQEMQADRQSQARTDAALASMERRAARDQSALRDFGGGSTFDDLPAQANDVLNPSGQPFKTKMAAERAAKKTPGAVVAVPGGFVVRPAEQESLLDAPQATPDAAAGPQADPAAAPAVGGIAPGVPADPAAGQGSAAPAVRDGQPEQPGPLKLPRELAGAKPRYSYGPKAFNLEFESDVDRAAYVIAQENTSSRDADYLKFVMDATGMDEGAARAYGRQVKDAIKARAKDADAGTLPLPDQRGGIRDMQTANAPAQQPKGQSGEWQTFPPETGSLNLPRAEMPQVKADHRGPMVNFLNARGIEHEADEVDPAELKPTQAEYSLEKVKRAQEFGGTDRAILISADGYVVDGHHQWLAKGNKGEPVKVIRLKAPIKDLLPLVREFPSSTVDTETANVQNQAPATEAGPEGAQAARTEAPAPAGGDASPAGRVSDARGTGDAQADGVKPATKEEGNIAKPNAAPAPGDTTTNAPAGKYQPPSKEAVWDEWRRNENPSFQPTARQQQVIDAVAEVVDGGAFYNTDVRAGVAKVLGYDGDMGEGSAFSAEVYLARQALDAKRRNSEQKAIAAELNLKPGDKLGTLIFNDFKVTNSVEVVSLSENGITANFKGKRGPVGVTFTTEVGSIKAGIERAHEKGKRKDSYEQFIAGRKSQALEPGARQYTQADAAAAERQLAQMLGDRIDAMQAQAVQKIGARFLPTMGIKTPVGKAKIKAAVTDFTRVNPLAAAGEFGVELSDSVKRPLEAQSEGRLVAEKAAAPAPAAPVPTDAKATHQDPGEKPEAATKGVVTDSLKTAAKNEDSTPGQMRKWLLAEIDKEMLNAPDRADYDEAVKRMGEKDAISMYTGNGPLGKNSETGFITFDVPGDGKFKVRNSVRGLLEFRKNVSASLGFKDGGQKTVKPEQNDGVQGGSGGQMAAIVNMIEEGDFEAARDYAEAVGINLDDVKVPRGEQAPAWKEFRKTGTVPPPPDTRPLPPQRTPAQIAEDERQAKEAEAKKPKDTGWNMAGTGYGGKRYRGRNITTEDGREIVARVYENAGNYDEVEIKVDGVRKFTVRDSFNAQDKADAFIKTLTDGTAQVDKGKLATPEKMTSRQFDAWIRERATKQTEQFAGDRNHGGGDEGVGYIYLSGTFEAGGTNWAGTARGAQDKRDARLIFRTDDNKIVWFDDDTQQVYAAEKDDPRLEITRAEPQPKNARNPQEVTVTVDGADYTVMFDEPLAAISNQAFQDNLDEYGTPGVAKAEFRRLRAEAMSGQAARAKAPKPSPAALANQDKALLDGVISVQDYMEATGLTDDDVGVAAGDGLRQQADREAKAADPYHQGIQKMQDALSDQMKSALDAPSSTPQQRKSKEERMARITRDRATLDMIARGFEHPFDNRYVTKLSPILKSRFNKQWESIKTGEFAKQSFQDLSYKLWAQKVINKAREKMGMEPAGAQSAPENTGVVDDFGEKLPPARRAMAAKLGEALTDDDIASQPLSKVWPLDENEAIEDQFAAAVAHTMREAIPAKPRVAYKVKSWVSKVKTLRDLTAKVMSGDISKEKLMSEMEKVSSLRDMAAKIRLLEQIDRSQWKRVGDVSEAPGAIRYEDGKAIPSPSASVTIDGKSHWLKGSGNLADHMDAIKAMLEGDAPESKLKFEVFRATTGDRKVFISKKGDKEHRRLMEFDTVEEARKALKDRYADIVAAWEGVKGRDNITERDLRTAENRPRTGKDHRQGRDISAEEFQQTFGFRGGEFGKWVSQGKGAQERQFMLNSAYDALMDLSDIIGVPPKAISLDGTLGIAFGSRGGGWASAHFEPSNLVINLTKPRGAGALAHEWFHALDNYFSRKRGGEVLPKFPGPDAQNEYRRNNYITHKTRPMMVRKDGKGSPVTRERLAEWRKSSPGSAYLAEDQWVEDPNHKQGVRAEVEERFDELVKALDASPMLKRARAIDGVKTGDGYWSRTLERAARAFENFIQVRMNEHGYHNDFLVNVKPAVDVGKNIGRYPYLLPSEVAPIADAFTNLFNIIQTKDEDGKTVMFSRGSGQGITKKAATEVVDAIRRRWANGPEVVVVATMQDPAVPRAVREADIQQRSQGATGEPEGFWYGGKAYVVAGALNGPADVVRVLFHETLGHYGLRGVFGEGLTPILKQLAALRRKEVLAKASQYGLDMTNEQQRLQAAEEVLAEMAQTRPELGFVQRAIAAVRAWLRKNVPMFKEMELTDAEVIQNYILPARRFVEQGPQGQVDGQTAPAFSRAEAGSPDDTRAKMLDAIPAGVMERLEDLTSSQRGFNRWWHRTVGTQLHKAKINKEFGRVFYAVQDFMKDTSRMATIAADQAPDLLPQVDSLKDVQKLLPQMVNTKARRADLKAASDALFDGTLRYTRNDAGEAVLVEPGSEEPGGLVWTDAELRGRGLNEKAIAMYRQARAAINQSMDNLLAADVYRMMTGMKPEMLAGDPSALASLMDKVRRAAASDEPLSAVSLALRALNAQGAQTLAQIRRLRAQVESEKGSSTPTAFLATSALKRATDLMNQIEQARESMQAKIDRIAELQARGYAPLMRFGPYTVDVVDPDGTRVFFGMYETQFAANRAARRFREQGLVVSQGVKSQREFELLKGVSPETAMLFADMLGIEKNDVMQAWLQNALAEQSALKRHIRRKGIEGFDDDASRVVAAFLTSNSRAGARALHGLRIQEFVENVREGDVKDEAIALAQYVDNPREEAQAVRSLLFVNYIGGSIASALVNLTQTLVQTFPYLAQFGGAPGAARRLAAAMKLALGKIEDPDLAEAVQRAERDGVIKPQEVFQLQAEASRSLGSDLRVRAGLALWGSFFQAAEVFNRRVAFIAAYQTAKERKIPSPFAFAENAVDETQGVFNKCVDRETEMLTATGWKRFDQLAVGDAVFSIDGHGAVVDDQVVDLHIYNGQQKVLRMENSNGLTIVATPNHDHLVQAYSSRDEKWQSIRKVRGDALKQSHFLLRAPLADGLGRNAVYTDDEVALFAWVAAEGHFFAHRGAAQKRGVGLVQSQICNPRYVREIDDLLERLGGHCNRKVNKRGMVCWQLRKPLWSKVHQALPDKRVTPEFAGRLTVDQMRIFLDTFTKADGHFPEDGGQSITQKSIETLDVLQLMAVLSGRSSTVYHRMGEHPFGVIYVAKNSVRAHVRPMVVSEEAVDMVWCPQTTHGTWIARRNGRTFVTGNSNRPNWARGAVGATLFTFKTFTIQYVEFLKRLPPKEKALALAVLVVLSGFRGIPFAEDAEDIIDTVAQHLGYSFTTKDAMHRFAANTLGKDFAEFLMSGASGTGLLPFDVSVRLGMGDLLPATGLLKPSETRKEDQVLEVFGVAGGFVRDAMKKTWTPSSVAELSNTAWAPVAMRNLAKGWDMYDRGIYTDGRGRKVMDVTAGDAALKAIGLQPAKVASESRAVSTQYEQRALFTKVKGEISEQIALGMFEGDQDKVRRARERLADWNEKNPDAKIALSGQGIRRRVAEMRKDRTERFVNSTPRELRQQTRGALGD